VPLFMDIHHKVEGLTHDAATAAHHKDVAIQEHYGVRFLRYWFDETTGKIFCLSEAPNAKAVTAVHQHSHGLLADEIVEVAEGM
jgi:Protein of unknown function (DUF4242)